MTTFWALLYLALYLFQLFLIARLVMDYVMMFARRWQPARTAAVVLEVIWSVTDPPLKALRRVIPPLRVGGLSLDLGFFLLFIIVIILMSVVGRLATR